VTILVTSLTPQAGLLADLPGRSAHLVDVTSAPHTRTRTGFGVSARSRLHERGSRLRSIRPMHATASSSSRRASPRRRSDRALRRFACAYVRAVRRNVNLVAAFHHRAAPASRCPKPGPRLVSRLPTKRARSSIGTSRSHEDRPRLVSMRSRSKPPGPGRMHDVRQAIGQGASSTGGSVGRAASLASLERVHRRLRRERSRGRRYG
jgi:hypothetical protein